MLTYDAARKAWTAVLLNQGLKSRGEEARALLAEAVGSHYQRAGRHVPILAWAHGPAAISHEAALVMRGLGDFNPTRVDLTIAPRYFPRKPVQRTLRLWRGPLSEDDIQVVDGVRAARVYTALC